VKLTASKAARSPLPNTEKAIGSAEPEDSCCALDRLQWVRNGLTLTTADDDNSKVLSERGDTAPSNVSAIRKQARGPPPTTATEIRIVQSTQNLSNHVRFLVKAKGKA
jgi:hypothetical protein